MWFRFEEVGEGNFIFAIPLGKEKVVLPGAGSLEEIRIGPSS